MAVDVAVETTVLMSVTVRVTVVVEAGGVNATAASVQARACGFDSDALVTPSQSAYSAWMSGSEL